MLIRCRRHSVCSTSPRTTAPWHDEVGRTPPVRKGGLRRRQGGRCARLGPWITVRSCRLFVRGRCAYLYRRHGNDDDIVTPLRCLLALVPIYNCTCGFCDASSCRGPTPCIGSQISRHASDNSCELHTTNAVWARHSIKFRSRLET